MAQPRARRHSIFGHRRKSSGETKKGGLRGRLFSSTVDHSADIDHARRVVEDEMGIPESDTRIAVPSGNGDYIVSTDRYAFGFDIDGVLLRGKEAIPEAKEALRILNGDNEYNLRVPFMLLTNGGGKTEEERCRDLSRQLETEITPAQFICSHTPMKQLAGKYQTVLVVGNDVEKCRAVAKQYGFRDVLTTHDVIKTDPTIAPFKKLTEEEKSSAITRCLPETVVDAIIVFSSSKDWGADQQVILDLCMSQGGRFGTRSRRFGEGPVVYFAHSDVIWSNEHEFPRLGLGALRTSLEAIYRELTGQELGTVAIGKPQSLVFHFAERTLRQHRFQDHGIERAPETIYFVGDTPESDILGTNKYHTTGYSESVWRSILVESGVYEHGTTPRYKPFKIVPNALAAVRFAMELEQDKLMNHKQRRTFRESIKRLSR